MFSGFCIQSGGYMAMQVRQLNNEVYEDKPISDVPPSSMNALAKGITRKRTALEALKDLEGVLPVRSPETEPIVPPLLIPPEEADVVDFAVATKVQKKSIKRSNKSSKKVSTAQDRHSEGDDERVARDAWYRGYASLTQDPSDAQLAGRTKANTTDGRSVKVNTVRACWLLPGDRWGGTPHWETKHGVPVDGVVNSVHYPTRWKYKQATARSQASRLAVAHESVPVSELWEASNYSKSVGPIQGFEGFARPPSLDQIWDKHYLDLVSGKLSGNTIHEAVELSGLTFQVRHGEGIAGPYCEVVDRQGNRFSYPFKFTSKQDSYADAKRQAMAAVWAGAERLLKSHKKVDEESSEAVPVTIPAVSNLSNAEIARETIKALAGEYHSIIPESRSAKMVKVVDRPVVVAANNTTFLLQDQSKGLARWFKKRVSRDPSVFTAMSKVLTWSGVQQVISLRGAEDRIAKSDAFFKSLGYKPKRGMTQSQAKSYMRWWNCNVGALEPNLGRLWTSVSLDPYDQMKVFWINKLSKGVDSDNLVRILNRINTTKMQKYGTKDLANPVAYPLSEHSRFPKNVRSKVSRIDDYSREVKEMSLRLNVPAAEVEKISIVSKVAKAIKADDELAIEGDLILADEWEGVGRKVVPIKEAASRTTPEVLHDFEKIAFGSLWEKDGILFMPKGNSRKKEQILQMPVLGDLQLSLPVLKEQDADNSPPWKETPEDHSLMRWVGEKLYGAGQFLSQVVPK